MNYFLLIPVYLGFATIFQTHLLKKMGEHYSLFMAAIINNITGLILVIAVYYFSDVRKEFDLSQFKFIYLLAGFLGMSFVVAAPFAVSKVGPARFFIILVAAEILFGLLWQYTTDPTLITPKKILAALLVAAGSALSI